MNIPIEIIGLVIGAFLSILGFGFLVIWQNTKAINSLSIALSEMNVKDTYEEKECSNRHCAIEKYFGEHSAKIEAHGIIITEHEYKIKELQKV